MIRIQHFPTFKILGWAGAIVLMVVVLFTQRSWLTSVTSVEAQVTDHVTNGDFADAADVFTDQTDWTSFIQNVNNTVNRVVPVDRPGNPAAELIMNTLVGANYYSNLRIKQTITGLQAQTSYTLLFAAKASVNRTMEVDVVELPYNFLGLRNPVNIGTSWQMYSVTFRTPATMPAGTVTLAFSTGEALGTILVDDISMTQTASSSFTGSPTQLFSFDTGEVWSSGKRALSWPDKVDWFYPAVPHDTADVHEGTSVLKLMAETGDRNYAERVEPIDLSGNWDLSTWVYVENPKNIGRVIILFRSGTTAQMQWAFASLTGLQAGWNQVVIPKSRFYSYPWTPINWSTPWEVGIKLETNDNGPATVWFDDLQLQPTGVGDYLAPVITQVSVSPITSTLATVTWTTDEASNSLLDCGQTTTYGTTVTSAIALTQHTLIIDSLSPHTTYHCQVVSVDSGSHAASSGDFMFTTDPAIPWVMPDPTGLFQTAIYQIPVEYTNDFFRTRFTSTIAIGFEYDSNAAIQTYLDTLQAHNRQAWIYLSRPEVLAGNTTAIVTKVRVFKNHPALAGWYLFDEPENNPSPSNPIDPILLQGVYDAVLAEDPNHPISFATAFLSPTYPYRNSLNSATSEFYPIPNYQPADIIDYLDPAVAFGLPTDFVLQGYEWDLGDRWPGEWPQPGRLPTKDEFRLMAYLALNHGAKNLDVFAHFQLRSNPGADWQWTKLNDVINELMNLAPVWSSPDTPATTLVSSSDPNLDVGLKQYDNRTYAIVVNKSTNAVAGTLIFSGLAIDSAKEVVTQQPATSTNTTVDVALGGYGVHIYELTPTDITPPSVSITGPIDLTTVSDVVTLTAVANDNLGIAGVQFQIDGVDFGSEDVTAPFEVTWPTTYLMNGAHTITAVAHDAAGNSTTSAPITVTMFNPIPDTTAPNTVSDLGAQ